MYYHKLSIETPTVVIVRDTMSDEYKMLEHSVKYYSIKNAFEFLNILPESVHHKFDVVLLDAAENGLPCHIDNTTASINFYIDPGTFVTEFFQFKESDAYQDFDSDGPYTNIDNLLLVDRFVAKPGDVYVLNTKQLHRVFNYETDDTTRLVVQLQTTHFTVDDILGLIHDVKTKG
jgi:hypothetical protein